MNEQERDGFIRKIGISAGDSDELDDEEEENDPEHHKYNCKKCQVSFGLAATEMYGRRYQFLNQLAFVEAESQGGSNSPASCAMKISRA